MNGFGKCGNCENNLMEETADNIKTVLEKIYDQKFEWTNKIVNY